MDLHEFINHLTQASGESGIVVDDDNHAAFSVAGIVVHFQMLEELRTAIIYSGLLELPPTKDDKLFKLLLEMNYLFQGTRGATLSLKPESNELMLAEKLPHFNTLEFDEILQAMTNFVNAARTLQAMLENYRESTDSTEEKSFSSDINLIRI